MWGLILPLTLSLAVFRLLSEEFHFFPDLELEYLSLESHFCSLLSYLDITWQGIIGPSTLISVIFRSGFPRLYFYFFLYTLLVYVNAFQILLLCLRYTLVKYPNRGLADDVFWFNGSLKLFEQLAWISTLTLISVPQMRWLFKLIQGAGAYFPYIQRFELTPLTTLYIRMTTFFFL